MKAFMVFNGDPYDGCMLVYAETANKARSVSHDALFEWEYIETSAKRMPEFDQYWDGRTIVEDNSELPSEAPKFYNDSYL